VSDFALARYKPFNSITTPPEISIGPALKGQLQTNQVVPAHSRLRFTAHPNPYISRAIFQLDVASLAAGQELHRIPMDEGYFFQVQRQTLAKTLHVKEPVQFVDIVELNPPRQVENYSRI
jgi:hypothetical protein